ncbi:MAG: sulfatase-like hydrolase/transferase [Coraliomargaritaceae bacterium]
MKKRILICFCLSLSLCASAFTKKKPNILWIITDDQRADSISCVNYAELWQTESRLGYVHSPNIDRMAENGVLFSRAYCNSPVCGSSRASMQTGSYPHHIGRYAFERSHMNADVSRPIIPQILEKKGYVTAGFGKFGHLISGANYQTEVSYGDLVKHRLTDFSKSSKRVPGQWGPEGLLMSEDVFYGPDSEESMFYYKAEGLSAGEAAEKKRIEEKYDILRAYTRELSSLIVGGVSSQPSEKTLDGEIYSAFENYLHSVGGTYTTPWGTIEKGPEKRKPLFAYLGFHLPHTPVLPPAEFRELFKDEEYNIPEFSKAEIDRLPLWARNIFVKMNFDDMTAEDKQQAIRDYYAFCAFGDYLVGKAVKEFKAYSEEQGREWLIVFVAGDHGWHLGEQGIHAKFAPWVSSTRGAVIVESSDKKRFPEGMVCKKNVEYVDFATTFYKAAGIKNPARRYSHLDGVPLDDTLHGRVEERPYVWTELNQVTGPWASMRTKDFMFGMKTRPFYNYPPEYAPNEQVRWGLDASLEKVEPILYDLRVDMFERINLAEEEEYQDLVAWFRNKVGRIALGDGRVEVNWKAENEYNVSDFALGADDKKLSIPESIIPDEKLARKVHCREFYSLVEDKISSYTE